VGVSAGEKWIEALNSDATLYGGGGQGNCGRVEWSPIPMHGRTNSLNLTVPPLATLVFHKDEI